MPARVDLHTHSTASDGTDTPAKLVDAASVRLHIESSGNGSPRSFVSLSQDIADLLGLPSVTTFPVADQTDTVLHFDIIYRSLLLWQQLPDSAVAFSIIGGTNVATAAQDGTNAVFWANIDNIIPGGVIGLNYCFHDGVTRFESDTILTNSPTYPWDSNPDDGINANTLSVRSVAGHENLHHGRRHLSCQILQGSIQLHQNATGFCGLGLRLFGGILG